MPRPFMVFTAATGDFGESPTAKPGKPANRVTVRRIMAVPIRGVLPRGIIVVLLLLKVVHHKESGFVAKSLRFLCHGPITAFLFSTITGSEKGYLFGWMHRLEPQFHAWINPCTAKKVPAETF